MKNITETHVLADAAAVAEFALQLILKKAEAAIRARGRFVLCLAGGSTPKLLYQLLAQQTIDYSQWYLIYGDERCLPVEDAERNSLMVMQQWLQLVDFPQAHHYPMPAELGAEQGASLYQQQISDVLPIDVCLLGMGEDGHTASLFPCHAIVDDTTVIAVHDSPKPPADRVSLNYPVINQSETVCFLVTGAGKQEAVKAWQDGTDLPVARIHANGETILLMDMTAKPV